METRTLWKTCSLLMSFNRALRSFTRVARSWILDLSPDSMALVSPMAMSRVRRMPPLGDERESQFDRPELDDGVKQILWSPASAAVNVNFPEAPPRWLTTRWSESKIS